MSSTCNSNCGLFDFMANEIGIRVLHPGGYEATDMLLSCCGLDENARVLDVACGAGTSAFYIARQFGSRVTGIDISADLISIARAQLNDENSRVAFEVADACKLPYADNTFDVVISQAFFVLIEDRDRALQEMLRVLKPGGILGALEKSWFSPPPDSVYGELVEKTCSAFVPRVKTFEQWESFFGRYARKRANTEKYKMSSGMGRLLKSEGPVNFVRILYKMIKNRPMRRRMMTVQKTFSRHRDYLGYGVYCFEKY
jgi:ubiquinone/menaquinone biosynthesis C-methylase UbiE